MTELHPDICVEIERAISGELRTDPVSRLLYSTDASIYQVQPLGVVFPRSTDDIQAIVEICARHRTPLLARGAGSSLAGQAIGPALILDTSRYLTKILQISPEERLAIVEPGVVVNRLNKAASSHGLMFGPDPASAERATIGGSIANNATGAHSILYGVAADHILNAEVVLADGKQANFGEQSVEQAVKACGFGKETRPDSIESALLRTALDIRFHHEITIRTNWPRVWRRSSGYNLNYLLPWSPSSPPQWPGVSGARDIPYPPIAPDSINLAPLFAGSEGTLGILNRITLRMVPCQRYSILGVLEFESIEAACDYAPEALRYQPSAVELIPGDLIQLARTVPAYARQMSFIQGNPAALLVVEFSTDEQIDADRAKKMLRKRAGKLGPHALIAETAQQQQHVWSVRKMGLGILNSIPGDAKPHSFIEDLVVPVEHLGAFVKEMQKTTQSLGVKANYYGHASAGCLHIRPIINLKDARGVRMMRHLAQQAIALALGFGGAADGEHGDGLARSEWLETAFGPEVMRLFRHIKDAADPNGILNPGKIINPPPMDENLRFPVGNGQPDHPTAWGTRLSFANQGSLIGAIEMCNGAGVCRKDDGVMCPSFQATREEKHSTRGRANLLRALFYGHFANHSAGEKAVYEALELCLACKGCKAECPSAVDMAKLKYEFLHNYYRSRRRRWRDYLFAYIAFFAKVGSLAPRLSNTVLDSYPGKWILSRFFGLTEYRSLPRLDLSPASTAPAQPAAATQPDVLVLSDAFSRYYHPETERAALKVLSSIGLKPQILPGLGAGRTLISKGFLEAAHRRAAQLLREIEKIDPEGTLPVVGIEPSEIYTLRDEFQSFFPNNEVVSALAKRSWMIDEYLIRFGNLEKARTIWQESIQSRPNRLVLLHGHCYQKAQPPAEDGLPVGASATILMLQAAGYTVEPIDCGCCGMAGAFGYEAEHYKISMAIGEISLFPAVRNSPSGTIIAAAGTSCRSQIEDGAGRQAVHPICLVADL